MTFGWIVTGSCVAFGGCAGSNSSGREGKASPAVLEPRPVATRPAVGELESGLISVTGEFARMATPSQTALPGRPSSARPSTAPGRAAAQSLPATVPAAASTAVAPRPATTVAPWSWEGPQGVVAGSVFSTPHFRLFTTTREDSSLRRLLPAFYEAAIGHWRSALGDLPAPVRPLETYLFGNRAQWADFTRERLGSDAGTYLALDRGGYTVDSQAVLFDLGRWDTLALAAHEGWHQYTQGTFRHPLPIWLEEGLATYMEGHRWNRGEEQPSFAPWRNFERFGALREAVRENELIPLDTLLEGMPQNFLRRDGQSKLLTYYGQVWALTHFLAEGENKRYRPALEELLRDAAAGRIASRVASSPHLPPGRPRAVASKLGKTLVIVYFNPDFAEFKSGYDRFVADITRRGTGDAVWRGESPLTSVERSR